MIHFNIIQIMERLGYKISPEGVCFGLSHMSMQAFLAEDLEAYDKRLLFIMNYTPDDLVRALNNALNKRAQFVKNWNEMEEILEQRWGKPIEKLTEEQKKEHLTLEEQQLIDLLPFFEGIRAYQRPQTLSEYFSFGQVPKYQEVTKVIPLVEPTQLKTSGDPNESHLSLVQQFSGQYSKIGLHDYFYLLGKYLKENELRASFILRTLRHTLTVHYDPAEGFWYLSGPNQLPSKKFHNKNALVSYVFQEMKETDGCSFVSNVFIKRGNEHKWKATAEALEQSAAWQRLHTITKKNATWTGYQGQGWLHKAVFLNDVDKVKKLIAHGADVNAGESLKAIHLAAEHGYTDILSLLINANADCNVKLKDKLPLTAAVLKGHLDAVQMLLPRTQQAQDIEYLDYLLKCASADIAKPIMQYKKVLSLQTYRQPSEHFSFMKPSSTSSVSYPQFNGIEFNDPEFNDPKRRKNI